MKLNQILFALPLLVIFSGCTISDRGERSLIDDPDNGSIWDTICIQDEECLLTDELYDPCESIDALHVDVSIDEINAHNKKTESALGDEVYDCDEPPVMTDYRALCQENYCRAVKN
jgi:hypothetical protein